MRIKEKFEKRINALFQEGAISTQQQLDDYIRSYFDGVKDAGICDDAELVKMYEQVNEMCSHAFMQPFYFTFGSWEKFPFQNGFLILYAENFRQAAVKFMELYPHPEGEDIVNCSDYYSQKQWDNILTRCYQNVEPFKVIGKVGYFYDERR